ncbi:MAG: hypothetical protein Q7U04_17095 [Bacteriovorax sp.]|nr:hypothetical protein [Bacteriovorax sp.]
MTIEYYASLLRRDYVPNPVYAEISTGNWIRALRKCIEEEYGNNISEWEENLRGTFTTVQGREFENLPAALLCLSQGMSLTLSLKTRSTQPFFPWNTVGLISDFYYSITNLFNVVVIGQTDQLVENHRGRIKVFSGIKNIFPHPFNMYTEFNNSLWNQKKLITQEYYTSYLPSVGMVRNNASESSINSWHTEIDHELAQDIILGYMRGTTGFYLEEKTEAYKKKAKNENFMKQSHKDAVNPELKRGSTNFMSCLYRYRTKAHYRDFIYLTNHSYEPSNGRANNYIDQSYIDSLFVVSYFTTAMAIKYLIAKLGRENAYNAVNAIKQSFKAGAEDLWFIYPPGGRELGAEDYFR